MHTSKPRRTILAVPGSSERFITKSRTLDVDAIFLDLEDAVAPGAKVEARSQIIEALHDPQGWKTPCVTVRVNDWMSKWTTQDLIEVIGQAGNKIDAVVLPKVTEPDHVRATDMILTQIEKERGWAVGQIGIEAQIEEAKGLLAVSQIAGSSPRLVSLVFGPGDFMASMGMGGLSVGSQPDGYDDDAFHHVLMSILVAARAHGLQAIDGPFVGIRDIDGFVASARKSAALGYDGKWVLHPDQVTWGNKIFTPNEALLVRARRILEEYEKAVSSHGGFTGAIEVDQEMVDEAGVKVAAALLSKAR
ncbi:MAG: CoA ester lyase [Propionibacteriaceae bacterium]|jgi:citrate lyase subunit beta/citryl-CoA lyase|nr:CoA ester lyase [Propionibacteriaceae bacterium]